MTTWFGELFPWQIAAVMVFVGWLMLAFDRERMRRARLSAEATFVHYAAWFYILGALATLVIGGLM